MADVKEDIIHNFLSDHKEYIGCVLFYLDGIFCVLIFAHWINVFIYKEIITDCCLEPESSDLKSSFDWKLCTKILICIGSLRLKGSSGPTLLLKSRIRENRWPRTLLRWLFNITEGGYPFCSTEVKLTSLVLLSSFLQLVCLFSLYCLWQCDEVSNIIIWSPSAFLLGGTMDT